MAGIYVHIPFCQYRCSYCDFNTSTRFAHLIDAYTNAVCREVSSLREGLGRRLDVRTIYFGGGTPSMLPIQRVEAILSTIDREFSVSSDAEISFESNPGTVDAKYLRSLVSLGVNRLCVGVQSSHKQDLKVLGRKHSFEDARSTLRWGKVAGFESINVDLIYGIPFQSLSRWREILKRVTESNPDHISLF